MHVFYRFVQSLRVIQIHASQLAPYNLVPLTTSPPDKLADRQTHTPHKFLDASHTIETGLI